MKAMWSVVVLLVCAVMVTSARAGVLTFQEHMEKVLSTYVKEEPPHTDQATEVRLGMYVTSMKINEDKMTMEMNIYVRHSWQDPRLVFDPETISGHHKSHRFFDVESIWLPDIFYRNAIEVNNMRTIGQNILLTINSTGHVWFVPHQKVTLACPMKFQRFPVLRHTCPIMFESYGYTMETVYFSWLAAPVDIDKSVTLSRYTLEQTTMYDCSQNYTAGAFPCLELRLILRGDIGFYVLWITIPSALIVTMSWLIFWMGCDQLGMRLILAINLELLLFVLNLISSTSLSHGNTAYVTAADVWSIVCMLFIFAVMLESTFVNALYTYRKDREHDVNALSNVDMMCRVAFPVCYALFLAIYFGVYSFKDE